MKTPEQVEAWGLRIARETGYDGGNLKSLAWRSHRIRITNETAARWARTARVAGMKLLINTKLTTEPWARTTAGHTVTRRPDGAGHRYSITSPAWDYPILFTVAGFLRAVMTIEKHLGALALYVDGVYVDDEDPEADLYDDEGLEHLPLLRGAASMKVAA